MQYSRKWLIGLLVLFVVAIVGGLYFFVQREEYFEAQDKLPPGFSPSTPIESQKEQGIRSSEGGKASSLPPDAVSYDLVGILAEAPYEEEGFVVYPIDIDISSSGIKDEPVRIKLRRLPSSIGGRGKTLIVWKSEESKEGERIRTRISTDRVSVADAIVYYKDRVGGLVEADIVLGPSAFSTEELLKQLANTYSCRASCKEYFSKLLAYQKESFEVIESLKRGDVSVSGKTLSAHVTRFYVE